MLVRALRSSWHGSASPAALLLQSHLHTSTVSNAAQLDLLGDVPMAKKDPILGVTENFLADKNPEKINLGVVRLSTKMELLQSETGNLAP